MGVFYSKCKLGEIIAKAQLVWKSDWIYYYGIVTVCTVSVLTSACSYKTPSYPSCEAVQTCSHGFNLLLLDQTGILEDFHHLIVSEEKPF